MHSFFCCCCCSTVDFYPIDMNLWVVKLYGRGMDTKWSGTEHNSKNNKKKRPNFSNSPHRPKNAVCKWAFFFIYVIMSFDQQNRSIDANIRGPIKYLRLWRLCALQLRNIHKHIHTLRDTHTRVLIERIVNFYRSFNIQIIPKNLRPNVHIARAEPSRNIPKMLKYCMIVVHCI